MERARLKFSDGVEEVQQSNEEIEEMLNNPISQLYAQKHPEVIEQAKEFHYV